MPSWLLLFAAVARSVGDPAPGAPASVHESNRLYFLVYFYSGAVLFLSSLVLAAWGIRRDRWASALTCAAHVLAVAALLFLL